MNDERNPRSSFIVPRSSFLWIAYVLKEEDLRAAVELIRIALQRYEGNDER